MAGMFLSHFPTNKGYQSLRYDTVTSDLYSFSTKNILLFEVLVLSCLLPCVYSDVLLVLGSRNVKGEEDNRKSFMD